ncbi:MAG TPA: ATP-binding protein [Terriglobia bacterium]|nr:ATP-binding protein [Terriglobia bacterium]
MSFDQESGRDLLLGQTPSGPLTIRMRMPSDPRLLPVVRSAISEFAAVWGFDEVQCRSITLAVDEALSNVIRHAYKNRCDCEVELNCQAHTDCLEVTFVDRGEPADPSRLCAQPLDEVALCGRGTHIIREIMDEVCYERVGEGNRLRLKKYLPAADCKASQPADQVRGKA